MNNIRIVFDIDDTICNNKNRDYENAIPFKNVIDKINKLHEQGVKIVLYTSRGMVSCKGDINKIIEKNKDVLERWLEKNDVKYDELIFGKPLGDMYIDDKAMNVREFIEQDFCKLSGHSGYDVIRLGNIVKKEMTDENYAKVIDWYNASEKIANSPKIISNLYSTIYMEYVDGIIAYKCLNEELLDKIIEQVMKFKEIKYDTLDKGKMLKKINSHRSADTEWNKIVDECENYIKEIDLTEYASLSHGDYTLANIVVKDGELYLLDSLYDKESSSYLLDFAKLKMSLDGYEERFCGGPHIDSKYRDYFVRRLKELGILEQVKILEFMYVVRLYNYNDDKELVKEFANERRKELGI